VHAVAGTSSPCGSDGRAHVHRFFELVYVDSGAGHHRVRDSSVPVSPGDLFLVAPGELHDASGLTPADRWVVAFSADALDPGRTDADVFLGPPDEVLLFSFLRPHGADAPPLRVLVTDRPRWRERLAQLQAEIIDRTPGYLEAVQALLVLVLVDTTRLAAPHLRAYAPATRPLLTQVFRHIEAHFAERISLRDVAAAVGYAPAYLTDVVRRETGRPVLAWIVERRMAASRYLLLETDDAVQQVANAVGYSQAGHFIRQFHRFHGQTPRAWRARQRGPASVNRKIAP
jgi:AraC-like DNA-binding protein